MDYKKKYLKYKLKYLNLTKLKGGMYLSSDSEYSQSPKSTSGHTGPIRKSPRTLPRTQAEPYYPEPLKKLEEEQDKVDKDAHKVNQ